MPVKLSYRSAKGRLVNITVSGLFGNEFNHCALLLLKLPEIILVRVKTCPAPAVSDPGRALCTWKSTLVYPDQTHLTTWVAKPSTSRSVNPFKHTVNLGVTLIEPLV